MPVGSRRRVDEVTDDEEGLPEESGAPHRSEGLMFRHCTIHCESDCDIGVVLFVCKSEIKSVK